MCALPTLGSYENQASYIVADFDKLMDTNCVYCNASKRTHPWQWCWGLYVDAADAGEQTINDNEHNWAGGDDADVADNVYDGMPAILHGMPSILKCAPRLLRLALCVV